MKSIAIFTLSLFVFGVCNAQQSYYDVTPGNGNGLRFWGDNNYKIHMGRAAEYAFGPVSDYTIKMNMAPYCNACGWAWGIAGAVPIAALNTLGQMQIANSFTVGGDIIMPSASGNKQIYTWNANDANWRIGMSLNPGFTRSLVTGHIQYVTYSNSTTQGFAVGVNGGNSSFEIQGIDHAAFFRGNVGIGTTASATPLVVRGATTTEESVVNVSNLSDQDFHVRLSAAGAGTKRVIIGPSTLTRLSLGVGVMNGNEHLTIINNGNVGISTTSPSTKLSLGAGLGSRLFSLYDYNTDWYGFGIQGYQMRLQVGSTNAKFSFFGGDTNEVMTIQGSGNVGIGTTSPNQKLTVNGTIYGKEVKVDLNVPGPDYVFDKDYKLPSLDEIKSYIDANKHLPEVPSAKEMEEKGINVSEMNMILLKKVEELTLHLIQLKKDNESLRKENQIQDQQIKSLLNRN